MIVITFLLTYIRIRTQSLTLWARFVVICSTYQNRTYQEFVCLATDENLAIIFLRNSIDQTGPMIIHYSGQFLSGR